MEIYSLRVLGARVQNENYKVKIKVSKSRALGESPFLTFSSFYWVLAFLGLGPPRSSFQGQHLQISLFSVFTSPSLFSVSNIPLHPSYKNTRDCV